MGELHAGEFPGKWIWKVDILPRIKTFVWQCYHNNIEVKDCLVRRGMLENGWLAAIAISGFGLIIGFLKGRFAK